MSLPHILIVEDEQQIRHVICAALENTLYQVTEAETCASGLWYAQHSPVDLVVLDLGLPDGDGLHFIQTLRGTSSVPILVLSARSTEYDKINALDAGADDYLAKPFAIGELQARVRALLRRSKPNTGPKSPVFRFGEVEVDLSLRKVSRQGLPIHLTPIELKLLGILLSNTGRVMTHRHLLREVWGSAYVESNHYLRIYVGHLRQKLEADPTQPSHILTETGIGYRFQP